MCMSDVMSHPRSRRFMRLGMGCLILGLVPQAFGITFGVSPSWMHAISGFFLGVSIVANIAALRICNRARRHPQP